jgi:hypothetical protein
VQHTFGVSESQGVAFVVWTAIVTDFESAFLAICVDKSFLLLGIPSNGHVMPLTIVNYICLGTTNPIASPTDYFNRASIGAFGARFTSFGDVHLFLMLLPFTTIAIAENSLVIFGRLKPQGHTITVFIAKVDDIFLVDVNIPFSVTLL